MHHFHQDYNTPCLPPPRPTPLNFAFCITIVFDFSWDDCNTPEEKLFFFLGGGGKGGKQDALWSW